MGPGDRLAVPALCNYLQAAAGRHADHLGVSIHELQRRHRTWVLARLRLELDELPARHDTVTVETWPSGRREFWVSRDFLVYDGRERPVVRATSIWFVIDLAQRRLRRLSADMRRIPVPERERALPDGPLGVEAPRRVDHERRFRVDRRHLDVNAHVNHVRYVEWALATVPSSFLAAHRPAVLEVDFRAEAKLGQEVVARAEERAGAGRREVICSLTAGEDEKEVARLNSAWVPRAAGA